MEKDIIENSKILIVDDQPGNLSILFEYLTALNADVRLIQEAEEAINAAEFSRPDIILLDIMMPEINGYEVCQKLKENKTTSHIPVIFMSGLSNTEDIVKGLKCGGVDYITKPVRKEEVIARISTHLKIYRAEEEIRRLNSALEERVTERTAQLEASNRELKNEIIMRKEAERIIAEQRDYLNEQRDYLNRIIDGSPVIICEFLPDGTIKFINPVGEKITGYSIEEIAEQKWVDLFCSFEQYRHGEHLYKEVREGHIIELELELVTKDCEKRIISWKFINRFNEKGEYINTIAFGNDVTERKRSEEERKKLEDQIHQSEKINALGCLAREIAHDFNNILAGIVNYAEVALLIATKPSVKEELTEILNACNRAKELIRHIQSFTHHAEQKHMPVNINLLLKETLNLIRITLPDTIKLTYNIDEKSRFIMADSSQIHRMLMNLYTNSIYAMKEKGGVLEISLTNIEVTPETMNHHKNVLPGEYACVTIKDSGCGMNAAVMKRLFEPYFTTKKTGEGTGLGLSIVHNIVKNCRGEIKVESVVGEGTKFYIYLPLIAFKIEAISEETRETQKMRGSILLVDDDLDVFQAEKLILEMFGYEVTGKTSSINALKTFASAPDKFDLVIADYNMPEMGGSEFIAKLLNINPDIPIILCSGSIELDKPAGIKGFIMKPFDIREIAEMIENIIKLRIN